MPAMTEQDRLLLDTRRQFFSRCGLGVGRVALASMLSDGTLFGAKAANPLAPKPPHFPARVKSVIYLFMAGGPSQLEMFDYKPKLQEYDGKTAPESILKGKRFAFMDSFTKEPPKLLGSRREFKRYGKSGLYVSELLPNIGSVADDIALISGVSTDNFNHGPAKCFINTGSVRFGRPSIGAWATYGIGSVSEDLPGFVVQFGLNGSPAVTAKWAGSALQDDPASQSNVRGSVTFATAGPNTRTTQVFINLNDNRNLDAMGFTPFGTVVEGMNVVMELHSGYGEGAPTGNGPDQGRIRAEGNAYLERDFPQLDYIKKATIIQ